ncbi:hypothetical protein KY359_01035 [Candidatus Woesearchaeota archaeon]|nr:hypothetical protein [Candidatus Woesearchaeota archaeon]
MMTPKRPFELHKPWVVRLFSLNYKHIFSFEFLYKRLHEWLVEEGYCEDSSGSRGDKWIEKLYLERVSSNGAKQIWVWWRMDKTYANDFFKFYLDVDFHGLNLKSEQIVVDGTKVDTNKGEVEVFITAKMELDPKNEWEKNFILKNPWLQNFYLNRIYKDRIEEVENELVRDAARLLGATKQYMQLESWLPEYAGPPFHVAKGE